MSVMWRYVSTVTYGGFDGYIIECKILTVMNVNVLK